MAEPLAWLSLLLVSASTSATESDPCARLTQITLDKAVVESAALSDGVCRVYGTARPVPGSQIRFAVYLPMPDRWSGRYYQIGNGGFAGAIHLPTLDEGAWRGDAIAATDTGHQGTGFDASWAPGNPVALADYGWRSIKSTRDAAQKIIAQYYGRHSHHHYFMGCSNGGRMALMAAARWPDDWDGVIAGAPANPWTVQLQHFSEIQARLRAPGGWLDRARLEHIRNAARNSCPAKAWRQNVLQRPDLCSSDFAQLACRARERNSETCLSPAERRTLRAITAAGYQPATMDVADWERWIANPDAASPSQATFAEQAETHLFGYYDRLTLQAHLDVQPADLLRFRKRGGKILSYFGWSDAVIAPELGLKWYQSVATATKHAGAVTDFYRLFMVPGMLHCQGGDGAMNLGQSLDAPAYAQHPDSDIRLAMEQWVETGHPPEVIRDGSTAAPLRPFQTTGNNEIIWEGKDENDGQAAICPLFAEQLRRLS